MKDYSTVCDFDNERFYYICGKVGEGRYGKVSNQIVWYDMKANVW
jgi:hypothetical protein